MNLFAKCVAAVVAVGLVAALVYFASKKLGSATPAPHALTAAQQANVAAITAALTPATPSGAATAATPAAASRTYVPLTSLDAAKNTISTTSVPTGVKDCNALCDNTPGCVATSYSNRAQSCALKAQVAGAAYDADKTLSVLATDLPTTFPNTVANGDTVAYGQPLVSPGGKTAMVIGADNGLIVYSLATGQPVFSANTGGKGTPPAYLSMQNDNNFVLYDSKNTALWATGTNSDPKGAYSFTLSDGSFAVGPSSTQPKFQASWSLGTSAGLAVAMQNLLLSTAKTS